MIAYDVLETCWQLLNDTEEPHVFYPSQRLLGWVNEAVEQIRQRRPECILDSDGIALVDIVPVTGEDDTISLDARWKSAIVEWVVARCYQTDMEDKGDQSQADIHLKLFESYVGR